MGIHDEGEIRDLVVERKNKTLLARTRSMLSHSILDKHY